MEKILKKIMDFYNLDNIDQYKTKYNSASDFELSILIMRTNRESYGFIQKKLGDPPKKKIREILLKFNKDLIDIDCNYNKLK